MSKGQFIYDNKLIIEFLINFLKMSTIENGEKYMTNHIQTRNIIKKSEKYIRKTKRNDLTHKLESLSH